MASELSRAAAPGPALPPGGAPGQGLGLAGQAPSSGASSIMNPAVIAAAGGTAHPTLAAAAVLAADGGAAAAPLVPNLAPAAFGSAADAQRLAAAVLRVATDTYSLSVVRLADPEHATVAEVGPGCKSVRPLLRFGVRPTFVSSASCGWPTWGIQRVAGEGCRA